ncbi:MAG: response regulator transcription factor, partial [Acidimicrobiales bacterium]
MTDRGTVLVVDDEQVLRDLVRPYLEADGFTVVEARNGADALQTLRRGGVDLCILDVMLPGEDGFSVLRQARAFTDVPVIMLTARRDEAYRVAGLRQGADDYVVKPFSPSELVARTVANLRRARGEGGSDHLSLGEISVDLGSRTAHISTEEVELTRREFDLLVALAQNPGRVLTREALLRSAWGTEYVTPKTVDVHIANL